MYLLQKYRLTDTLEINNELPEKSKLVYGDYPTQRDNDSCGPMCCYFIWQKLMNPSNYMLSTTNITNEEIRQKVVEQYNVLVNKYRDSLTRNIRPASKQEFKQRVK